MQTACFFLFCGCIARYALYKIKVIAYHFTPNDSV